MVAYAVGEVPDELMDVRATGGAPLKNCYEVVTAWVRPRYIAL